MGQLLYLEYHLCRLRRTKDQVLYLEKHGVLLTALLNVILSHIHISLMFCHYISCIYSYRLWNLLTVLLNVILSYIQSSLIFCYYISCIYTYKLLNVSGQCPSQKPTLPFMNNAQYAGLKVSCATDYWSYNFSRILISFREFKKT